MQVEWEKSSIQELDISATDLSTECLIDMLTRIPSLKFLSAGQINGFNDSVGGSIFDIPRSMSNRQFISSLSLKFFLPGFKSVCRYGKS